MSLWGSNNHPTYMPKSVVQAAPQSQGFSATQTANANFGANGGTVWGITSTKVGASANGKYQHPGWVHVKRGTGPVSAVSVVGGGTGYTNSSVVTFSAGIGNANATGNVVTNGSGVITSITITAGGSYYTTPTISVADGSGAALTVHMGGRANRVQSEVLVAMGSMTTPNAGSDYTNLP